MALLPPLPRPFSRVFLLSGLVLLASGSLWAGNAPVESWPAITSTAKPWVRWWWPGSAVDPANLRGELGTLAAAGIGGVEITPIYGAEGAEGRYVDYLSPRWVELLATTGREAQRLGLRVDMATGTGWPFGGPMVPEADGAHGLAVKDGQMVLIPTRQQVKRAAPGGAGRVLDPYNASALQRYLATFDAAFAPLPDAVLRGQFHDSFEYYGANATAALPEAFAAQHGYALEPYLADLLAKEPSGDAEILARVRRDYRMTLDQLHQAYLRTWADWAHRHGWQVRNQSHGAPANLLDLYAIADIPETEVFGSTPFPIPGLRRDARDIRDGDDLPEPLVTRMAASAAHVEGKPLVSCETATWLRDHWKVTLADLKPEMDRVFLDGINHLVFHGTCYSSDDAPWPGWYFYAATQFNDRNPWWRDFPAVTAYVGRVQSILQASAPDNDVLLYWPLDDLWQSVPGLQKQLTVHDVGFITDQPVGAVARDLADTGIGFDYLSAAQISRLRARGGQIVAPGGRYATLIVPACTYLEPGTLRQLLALADAGAIVVFAQEPQDVPGLANLDARRSELQMLWERASQHGRIRVGDPLAMLGDLPTLRPEPMVAAGLDCIRRKSADGWDYFIVNLGAETREGWYPLGVHAQGATLLNPLNGQAGIAQLRPAGRGVEVYLQLAPGESRILRAKSAGPATGEPWLAYTPASQPIPLDGAWQVSFVRGGPTLPASFSTTGATAWTGRGDAEADRFAGTARYCTRFTLDPSAADAWQLDLGDVRESARVWLNGTELGVVWSLPKRLRIEASHFQTENELVIEVTNTAANRIRDLDRRGVDWKRMHEINLVNIHYRPFDASGWDVQPGGLLGPVKLVPLQLVQP